MAGGRQHGQNGVGSFVHFTINRGGIVGCWKWRGKAVLVFPGMIAFVLFLGFVLPRKGISSSIEFSLNGKWQFSNGKLEGEGTVPGDIHSDLLSLGIIDDPLIGTNDVQLKWIQDQNWTYSKTFTVDEELLAKKKVILRLDGVDTIATVTINDKIVLSADNQFVEYNQDVKLLLRLQQNTIRLQFQSPTSYGKDQRRQYIESYGHGVPPECPPDLYNGDCNGNFIRKIQSSFSWDWGPSFPNVGIWQPMWLVATDSAVIRRVTVVPIKDNDTWMLQVEAHLLSPSEEDGLTWSISINELEVTVPSIPVAKGENILSHSFSVHDKRIELWWPNGLGEQKMYTATASIQDSGVTISEETTRFGFRTTELIQDQVNPTNFSIGTHFYFVVNGVRVFLKGTNWIPVSIFPAQNHTERMEFLLESSRIAGMNTMRVWGGGRYESDEFYRMADEKGIMIWQDMMFACALYPVHPLFLQSVRQEITQNVNRLKSHPSILVWAGNNENELGLVGNWFYDGNYQVANETVDYKKLYKELIKPIVNAADPSRPYLMSSPSNGVKSDMAGGVDEDPGNDRFGDIHFYAEDRDLWNPSSYQIPRCASEYGVQSIPSRQTMLRWLNTTDWSYLRQPYIHRQHHIGGDLALPAMVFSHFHFPLKATNGSESFMDKLAYYTQFNQAMAYKTETEHYLRYQGRIDADGRGNTMCALYWQLNDVWAAPSWSSIDFDLRWKPAHYEVRRFFHNVIVTLHLTDGNDLEVFVVSTQKEPLNDVIVQVDMLAWTNGFKPVWRSENKLNIKPLASDKVTTKSMKKWMQNVNIEDVVFAARILNATDNSLFGYETTLVPTRLFKIPPSLFGTVQLDNVIKTSPTTYALTIAASSVAPFVWIELNYGKSIPPPYFLSDNAFTMVNKTRTLILTLQKPFDIQPSDISVASLSTHTM